MRVERIGNIAKFINGVAFKPTDWSTEGLKIIRIQNLTNPLKAYNYTNRIVDKKYIVREGDVLVSWSATIDVFIWDGDDALLNQHIFKVDFDEEKVDKYFFIFALKQTIIALSNLAHGSTMKHVVKSDFENHKIYLPPLNYQRKIASILTKSETLIQYRKESIDLLDEYLKHTFFKMFGDPVANEKKWQTVNFSKLGRLERGISKKRPRNSPELLGGIYPLIQTGEVSNSGLFIKEYTKTYSELGLQQSKLWDEGTMLITIAANIARTSILTFKACFPDSVVGFIADSKESNTIYVHYLLSFFQKTLEDNAPQAAQKNINLSILRDLKVPKPPIELQNKFATIVEKVESIKHTYSESLTELKNLFGSLNQRVFNGKLDISNVRNFIDDEKNFVNNSKIKPYTVLEGEIVADILNEKIQNNITPQMQEFITKTSELEKLIPLPSPSIEFPAVYKKLANQVEQINRLIAPFEKLHKIPESVSHAMKTFESIKSISSALKIAKTSSWSEKRRIGDLTPIEFNEDEGLDVIKEEFSKRKGGFTFQDFEKFLKSENFKYTHKDLQQFIFKQIQEKKIMQNFWSNNLENRLKQEKDKEKAILYLDESIWFVFDNSK